MFPPKRHTAFGSGTPSIPHSDSTPSRVHQSPNPSSAATVCLEAFEQLPHQRHDLLPLDQVLQHEVQPVAADVAADVERVLVAAAADDADVALVRPGAAVRAAGHAHADRLAGQAQVGQRPLPARRQARAASARDSVIARPHVGIAGQAMLHFCTSDRFSGRGMPCSSSRLSIAGRFAGVDVAQQHVLLRRDADARAEPLDDRPQRRCAAADSPSSLIRPFSTLRPRNHLPSPCGCQPWCRSTPVIGSSRGRRIGLRQ